MSGFVPLPLGPRMLLQRTGLEVWGVAPAGRAWGPDRTVFGVVVGGRGELVLGEDRFSLRAGSFFVAPEPGEVRGVEALLIQCVGYRGLRQIGGPVEAVGRLYYIDGCTDTLLVSPPRLGDPTLNHLHIPAGTNQRAHIHRSERLGVILRGSGRCRTPAGSVPLAGGLAWWIPAGQEHSFATDGESLDVIAWHPDSELGPTDELHPMKVGTLPVPA